MGAVMEAMAAAWGAVAASYYPYFLAG